MNGEWSPFRVYGRKARRHLLAAPDVALLCALFAIAFWLFFASRKLPAYDWNWDLLCQFLILRDKDGGFQPGLLLRGLFTTLRISFWTVLFSFVVGGVLGSLAMRRSIWIKAPVYFFINIIRNTPPLVILFCVYFFAGNFLPIAALEDIIRQLSPMLQKLTAIAVAPPGQLDAMLAAVLALGCYQGAYVAEIMRAGLQAVPGGQWDASRALGFNYMQTLLWIVLPQAMRLIIPPLTGQCISTIKESALASLISLPELTFQSLEVMAVSNMTFETWFTAGVFYLVIGLLCAWVGRRLEQRQMTVS